MGLQNPTTAHTCSYECEVLSSELNLDFSYVYSESQPSDYFSLDCVGICPEHPRNPKETWQHIFAEWLQLIKLKTGINFSPKLIICSITSRRRRDTEPTMWLFLTEWTGEKFWILDELTWNDPCSINMQEIYLNTDCLHCLYIYGSQSVILYLSLNNTLYYIRLYGVY